MTVQTPREAAEALKQNLNEVNDDRHWPSSAPIDIIEAAFTARDRALLAEDEATRKIVDNAIVEVLIELCDDKFPGQPRSFFELFAGHCTDAALAALRRHRGVGP